MTSVSRGHRGSSRRRSVLDLANGETARIEVADVEPARARRLGELGLRAGESVRVIQRAVGGARVLAVNGSRIAIDGQTAERLVVVDESPS